ncbi:glycosyltransferase family 61 protein [Tabrizicola oligotrophica]|uniref:Glycosyltransferase family 61 protein n=1 Tax=Tabrizicola oligotrophica TaxID=2710650 RepID=A0A6M0QQP9_9RHOB|nr:glycosyltransferase family 61 protein [Tabrizicola oligotrophica]NEY89094.1 glycosyltransferase family 61 protein [Tabrizicola oligotrophica]
MRQALPLDPMLPLAGRIREVAGALLVPPAGPERPQPCGVFVGGEPVAESLCYGGHAHAPINVFPEPRAAERHLAGTYLFGGILSGHFGHMLVEGTGRLWALHGRTDVAGVLFFARPFDKARQCSKMFAQMAALLGLPPVTVLEAPVTVDRLVLAEQGLGSGELMLGRPEARALLRDRLAEVPAEGKGRRFYITRSGQPARRGMILGEQGLEALFAAQGYEVIRPEEFKLARQVAMLRGASHVVGTEGSPFHLLAMAGQAGCKVAVIQRRRSPTFAQICAHLEWFLGGPVTGLDQIASIHAPKKTRNPNLIYLEPDRPALWAALAEAGFVSGAPWANMTAEERRAALHGLETETDQRLRPVAAEDLPEDHGDEEKDAA